MKNFRILFLIATPLFFLFSCSVNQAKIETKLKKYFDTRNVDGTFTILDNAKGGITVYNMELDTMIFSPGATFQIITSLVGLENGEISNDSMVVKWDGVRRENKEWNKNLIFKEKKYLLSALVFKFFRLNFKKQLWIAEPPGIISHRDVPLWLAFVLMQDTAWEKLPYCFCTLLP